MQTAFRDDFAVKVTQLFEIPYILQQYRAPRACSHGVLVVGDRCAGIGSQFLLHLSSLPNRFLDGIFFEHFTQIPLTSTCALSILFRIFSDPGIFSPSSFLL
jgi:hypothetical protein